MVLLEFQMRVHSCCSVHLKLYNMSSSACFNVNVCYVILQKHNVIFFFLHVKVSEAVIVNVNKKFQVAHLPVCGFFCHHFAISSIPLRPSNMFLTDPSLKLINNDGWVRKCVAQT